MAETDTCIVGIHSCGCITYANARPDDLHRDDEREIARFIREGGQVVRTTVEEARKLPHFLVTECPHDPKGWEPDVETPWTPHILRMKRGYSRDQWVVYAAIENWTQGLRAGEVRKRDGAWWATEDWFNVGPGAHRGEEASTELGPFKTKKAAGECLLPLAIERGKRLLAQWAAERAAKEAARAA